MVICQYFQNNKCNFGNQCKNEHTNVKTVIKNDIESAIKGNQWPLSCYGPFRDRGCVPNFITDHSFEEIRALCYEAKNQGNLPAITNQFNQQVMDANNKMRQFNEFNNDIQTLIIQLYDSVPNEGKPDALQSNPFAISSNSNQASSIFGNASAGAFASGVNSNTFGGGGNNLFSNGNKTTTGFGGATAGNIFGGDTNSSSLFGGSSNTQTNTNSLFGGGGQQNTGLLFSNNQSTVTAAVADTNSPFSLGHMSNSGESNPNSFMLGNTQAASVFGGPATFGGQRPLFGQMTTGTDQTTTTNSGNIFTQPFGASAEQQANIFGNGSNTGQTSQNIFAQANQSIFGGASTTTATNNSTSIFGSATAATTTPATNVFGNNSQIQSSSIFGNPSAFGVTQQQQQQQQQQHSIVSSSAGSNIFNTQNSLFTTAASVSSESSNVFGGNDGTVGFIQQSTMAAPSSGIFSSFSSQAQPFQQQQQQQVFPQNPTTEMAPTATTPFAGAQSNVNQSSNSIYTQINDLTANEMEQFKAASFEMGKIPIKPPPRELCV